MAISEDIIREEFVRLTAIDRESFHEREMADVLTARLRALGFEVSEDDAGSHYGGNAGNVYGYLKGDLPGAPIMFSSHMDTVVPGIGKKAIVDGDLITSDGTTVLGGDDLTGILSIIHGIEAAIESGAPRRGIEVLFTIGEELYDKGSHAFDYRKLRAKDVYVPDMSGTPGRIALKAPSIVQFTATVTGRAAHAGFEPERGIHALTIASKAIARMPSCRPDDSSTFNIGTMEGGLATNIVPETCQITGEARSFSHERAMELVETAKSLFQEEADAAGGSLDFDIFVAVQAFETAKEESVVRNFIAACENAGIESVLTETFGGSDQNYYAIQGLSGVVMSSGMCNVHSTKEYCHISDMAKCARIVEELVKIAE